MPEVLTTRERAALYVDLAGLRRCWSTDYRQRVRDAWMTGFGTDGPNPWLGLFGGTKPLSDAWSAGRDQRNKELAQ